MSGNRPGKRRLKVAKERFGFNPGVELQHVTKLGPHVLERVLPRPPGSRAQRFTRQQLGMPVLSS